MNTMELYVAERTMHTRLDEVRNEARNGRAGIRRLTSGAWAWLGQRLVARGSDLQEPSTVAPAPRAASRSAS